MVEDMGEIVGDSGTSQEGGTASKKHSGGKTKTKNKTKTKEVVKESKKKKRGRPPMEPGAVPTVKKERGDNPLLTTTEASRICGLSTNIVRNWLKTGQLQGVALPTGVRVHQRVYKNDLLAFMEKCGLHIQEEDNGTV